MNKRKVYNYTRRTLAFLMAMIMTFSVVQSSALTAFAQTASDVVTETEVSEVVEDMETTVSETEEVSETVIEEVETTLSAELEKTVETVPEEDVIEVLESIVTEESYETSTDLQSTSSYYSVEEVEGADGKVGLQILANESLDDAANTELINSELISSLSALGDVSYDYIFIGYTVFQETLSKEAWNALTAHLNEEAKLTFKPGPIICSAGGCGLDVCWEFNNPKAFDTNDGYVYFKYKDLNLSEESGGLATFELDESFVAPLDTEVALYYEYSETCECGYRSSHETAFGTDDLNMVLKNGEVVVDGTDITYKAGESLLINGLQNLSTNTVYQFAINDTSSGNETYTGDEFTEDGRIGLEIAHYNMTIPEDSDFETEAKNILDNLQSKYEIISLCYDSVTDTVDSDLWNSALGKLNSENGQTVTIRANFSGGENAPDENWNFDNPASATADIKLGVSITVSEENGGGATFKLDESATAGGAAQEVCVNINADKSGRETIYNTYVSAFGTESCEYSVLNSDGNEVENTFAVYENNAEDNVYFNLGIVVFRICL